MKKVIESNTNAKEWKLEQHLLILRYLVDSYISLLIGENVNHVVFKQSTMV